MRPPSQIQSILAEQLYSAKCRFLSASARFREVIYDVPSGIPHPDGTLRIQQAGAEKTAALNELSRALDRYHEFMAKGKVPNDLGLHPVHTDNNGS